MGTDSGVPALAYACKAKTQSAASPRRPVRLDHDKLGDLSDVIAEVAATTAATETVFFFIGKVCLHGRCAVKHSPKYGGLYWLCLAF